MELRHLRSFVAVAEARHFGRAAKRLDIAQPALSRQIQQLEREVGAAVFERGPRGARLTRVGKVLLEDAKSVLAASDAAMERARASAGRGAVLRVASVEGLPPGLLTTLFSEFRRRFPLFELEYRDLDTVDQWGAVQAGAVKIGFCRYHPPSGRDLVGEPFISDPLDQALLPEAHPLAERSAVSLCELADDCFICSPEAFHPIAYGILMAAFGSVGYCPRFAPDRTTRWSTAAAEVAAGVGWMLVPRSFSGSAPRNTRCVRLEGFHIPFGVEMVHRRSDCSEFTERFVTVAREVRNELVRRGGAEAP
ncbi:MAG TPA: LysR substrate-binding domain-containing protein [Gemmatimonadales bacterium]|nr:LysR substrate-binding domain-containing protein [Gemmatimonadales bacterium]